jgi:glucosamine-6-phosphate deaminase
MMRTILTANRDAMGRFVGDAAAKDLRAAIQTHGSAGLIVATGASQFEVLSRLVAASDVDWSRVDCFHLDEYVGLSEDHPASFCRYLRERFAELVPLRSFHYLTGDADPLVTANRVGELLVDTRIDVALVGIGENGHLAFNDPPADFETTMPYLIVELDEACRQQQVGEGWFATMDDVPTQAISMSVHRILQSRRIYCSVPDERKAAAVAATILGDVTPGVPASILKTHADTILIIDSAAAKDLTPQVQASFERIA